MEFNSTGAFRGYSPFGTPGLGTGGNTVAKTAPAGVSVGGKSAEWNPTILYLFGLLAAEWVVWVIVTKYI